MKINPAIIFFVIFCCVPLQSRADDIDVQLNQPAIDRWMYAFNTAPGNRPTLSAFGSDREDPSWFDSRDGQIILAFDTGAFVPAGAGAYEVAEAEVSISFANDLVVVYDPTSDPWQMFLPSNDPRVVNDPDPGQPVELAGVGFRGGFTSATFQENSPYAAADANLLAPGVRNAFAACFNGAGQLVDISNHPREGFQPNVWAVGKVNALSPGQFIPQDSVMTFQVNVADPYVQNYLQQGLAAGRTFFSLSSLAFVVQQGGSFPSFYSKENTLVQLGLADAAHLHMKVRPVSECMFADLDCSGSVDSGDVGLILLDFGPCEGCPTDLDGSGEVDSADVGLVLLNFT